MKNILIVLIMVMVTGCNYLEDYSQDLVLASSVSDFDEVLLGDVYIPSKTEVKDLAWGDVGWWLHIMDDDVNGVVAREAENREWNYAMTSSYFGYTAWQMEVGRNYDGDNLAADILHRLGRLVIFLSEQEGVKLGHIVGQIYRHHQ